MARTWRHSLFGIALLALACAAPFQMAQQAQSVRPNAGGSAPAPAAGAVAGDTMPPVGQTSLRFAVVGDTGTGDRAQYETGTMLTRSREVFPFGFVLMVGDNMYGGERPQDFVNKFEKPYKALLDAKILFYASLGNHDDPNQRFYKFFNMNGERYYTFKRQGVRFFALDSNYMDRDQIAWLQKELAASGSDWKIAYFHHPLYSSGGTHGSEVDLRTQIEPLFLQYGVNVVLAGHEHFYERIKPQKGVQHFIVGGSSKLRTGDLMKTNLTAFGYDSDTTYMLAEVDGDNLHFQVLNRTGKRIDGGIVSKVTQTR